jgi:hypothetical protein
MTKARANGASLLIALAMLAIPAAASGPGWRERLAAIEGQLHQKQWEGASQAARALTVEIAQRSGGTRGDHRANADELGGALSDPAPSEETRSLARSVAFQAIAEAALGQQQEARWHWYLAQNLDRNVRSLDLAPYGKAGEFLERHSLAPAKDLHADLTDVLDPVRPEKSGSGFAEPVRTKAVYPRRPRDLRDRDRFSHVVFVELTVDAGGDVVQPVVVDAAYYPGLVYQAFEALREWRYQPATLNGKPIPFRYVVPVPFADDRPDQSAVFF